MGSLPQEVLSLNVHFKQGIEDISIGYFNYVITLFDLYNRHGVLPYNGSISEQPAKIIEIFDILDALRLEQERRQQEQQQKEMARNKRKKR